MSVLGLFEYGLDIDVLQLGDKHWNVRVQEVSPPEPEKPKRRVYPLYSQRHPDYAKKGTGYDTPSTFERWGCLITGAAMGVSGLLGVEIRPDKMNEELKKVNGFCRYDAATKSYISGEGNLMRFAAIWERWPEIEGVGHLNYPYPKNAEPWRMDANLKAGGFWLVKVDFDPTDSDLDQHWVLVVPEYLDNGEEESYEDGVYTIHDPYLLPVNQKPLVMPPAYGRGGWRAEQILFTLYGFNLK